MLSATWGPADKSAAIRDGSVCFMRLLADEKQPLLTGARRWPDRALAQLSGTGVDPTSTIMSMSSLDIPWMRALSAYQP